MSTSSMDAVVYRMPVEPGPLGLPELERSGAPFELLPVAELLGRANSNEWVPAAAFACEELTRHNGDNDRHEELRGMRLELHPLAVAEMLEVRKQVLTPMSQRRRMYSGYDFEGTMAWGLFSLERDSEPRWPYGHPSLSWRFASGGAEGFGSPYAIAYTQSGGVRRVLSWRRHELLSCVEPERFAAAVVREATLHGGQRWHPYRWQREPVPAEVRESQMMMAIASLCRGGRAGVLAEPREALRLCGQMDKMAGLLGGVEAGDIWAHPSEELAPVTLREAVTQVRACVNEAVGLRAHYRGVFESKEARS